MCAYVLAQCEPSMRVPLTPPRTLRTPHVRAPHARQGKVDSQNGRRGMVVSLDVEEYVKAADTFGFARVPGDDGPGELVQAFDEGMCWNVRWKRTGVYAHAPVSTRAHAPLCHGLLARPPARPPCRRTLPPALTVHAQASWAATILGHTRCTTCAWVPTTRTRLHWTWC